MVQAHAFDFPALSVQAEAVFRRHVNGAYANALSCFVYLFPVIKERGGKVYK